jgi:pimeloyl-ACP methyl ester carboxylesterase
LTKRDIYLIPGLGVDRRIFAKLSLPGYNLIYIDWIDPLDSEALEAYALRLALQIDTGKPFYLLGVSFGGMLATEIAKHLHPIKTVLVSSAATASEIPRHLRLGAAFHLDAVLPAALLKSANPLSYWLFGTKTAEEKALLSVILADIDPEFMKWALRAIAGWRNATVPQNLMHIHGDADHVLPISATNATVKVAGGGHLMIYSQADEVSRLIDEAL